MGSKRIFFSTAFGLLALIGYGAYGHWDEHVNALEIQKQTTEFQPKLATFVARAISKPVQLTLPGETLAYDAASIFPRATGYVAGRFVDIGTHVKRGDMLVRIDAPDLDRQLDQARAQLAQSKAALVQAKAQVDQAEANLSLADVTYRRAADLAKRGFETYQALDNNKANVVSRQAGVETARAGVTVAEANISAEEATVNRLVTLTGYEKVTAPFDGVITSRNIDTGDLVSADSSGGKPMFTMDTNAIMRVRVDVPQSAAVGMRDGIVAKVSLPQMPGHIFEGKVNRNSVALLSASRTLSIEVDIDNRWELLRPGLFVNVSFEIPRNHPAIIIPAESLIFNQQGLRVAVLQTDHRIHMQAVEISRDFGTSVELNEGLQGGEEIVLNPPASLEEGSKIESLTSNQQAEK